MSVVTHAKRGPLIRQLLVSLSRAVDSNLFVVNVLLLVHGLAVIVLGMAMGLDSYKYTALADTLLSVRFNYFRFFGSESVRSFLVFKIGFITLVALTKALFGVRWEAALTVVNLLAGACTGGLLVRLTRLVSGSRTAAWLSLALYAGSYDVIEWDRFVMTDATFLLPSFAVFYFATRAAAAESRATAKWIMAVVFFVITVFCRPTGCLVGVALICCVLFSPKVTRHRSVSFWRTMTVVVLLAATTFVSVAWIVSQPSRWRSTFMAPAVRVLSTRAAAGEVVEGHTYQRSPQGVAEYFALYVEKFARFFQVATGGFSRIHNAYELLFFVPLYACAIAAVAWMAMQRGIRGPEIAVLVALIEILTFAAFHAMTIVDYIWRYRLPVLPHLIFLAAFGAAQMQERLRRSPSEVNA